MRMMQKDGMEVRKGQTQERTKTSSRMVKSKSQVNWLPLGLDDDLWCGCHLEIGGQYDGELLSINPDELMGIVRMSTNISFAVQTSVCSIHDWDQRRR